MPEGPASTKKNVEDLANEVDLKGKRVFVRVDLNAPLSKNAPYEVTDDTRLRAAVPTIKFLKEKGAKVCQCSYPIMILI
jgi:phosphoglycerate kinase